MMPNCVSDTTHGSKFADTHLWEVGVSLREVGAQMEYYSMEVVYYHVAKVPSSLQYGRQDLKSMRCEWYIRRHEY